MKNRPIINHFEEKYKFLSNFFASSIFYQEEVYPTAEHLFQALKIKNEESRKQIRLASSPSSAKKIGQAVTLRKDWERVKDKLMYMVVRLKFFDPKLKKALLGTGTNTLIEGNYWHDNYWGDCYCNKCAQIKGKNQLGKTLMKVRKML